MEGNNSDVTKKIIIGVDDAHYAIMTDDAPYGEPPVYVEVIPLPGTKKIGVSGSDSSKTDYYDNKPMVTTVSKTEKTATFERAGFSNAELRAILGYQKTESGITVEGEESIPPYVAFGYSRLLKSGVRRLVWLLKGVFYMNDDSTNTREQSVTHQNLTITGVFIYRQCDKVVKITVDSDDPDIDPDVIKNWFTVETLNKLYSDVAKNDDTSETESDSISDTLTIPESVEPTGMEAISAMSVKETSANITAPDCIVAATGTSRKNKKSTDVAVPDTAAENTPDANDNSTGNVE